MAPQHPRRPRTSAARAARAPRALVALAAVALAAAPWSAGAPVAAAASPTTPTRVAGEDRVATAIAVSADRFPSGARGAVLASSTAYADALAGAPLAASVGGPLLITPGGQLDARVLAELRARLAPGATVSLLGGQAALGAGVEDAVRAAGFATARVSGADRYGTAAAIAGAAGAGGSCDLVLATGTGFADGAAASGTTSRTRQLLFTAGDAMPAATAAALATCTGGTVTAVGAPAATALGRVDLPAGVSTRDVVGADRYETSAALLDATGAGSGTVVLTTGQDFPDALVGGTYGSPVVLTPAASLPGSVAQALVDHGADVDRLLVVGGSRSVSDTTAQRAAEALAGQVAQSTPVPAAPAAGGTTAGVANRSSIAWNSGVYIPGSDPAEHAAFAAWRGAPLDVSVDWAARSSWKDVIDPSWLYRAWAGTPQTKVFGVAMLPEDDASATLAGCAAGDYDAMWRDFGRNIAASGLDDESIIRLGWEFNGDWYKWSAHDPAQWAECWRHIVSSAESTAPALRWDWNVNRGPGHSVADAAAAYPGDAYVDIVGVDSYDGYPAVTDEASWQVHYSGPYGLKTWSDFARAHGKGFSVPEWGVYPGTAWAGHNGGDNALYMEKMAGFFAENRDHLAYEAYFDEPAPYYAGAIWGPVLNPNASAAYARLW